MVDAMDHDPAPASLVGRMAQVLPTLVLDALLPAVLYGLLTHFGVTVLWALVAGGAAPALHNLVSLIVSRRLEPLGLLALTFLGLSAALSLISGDVFFSLIKESFLTGAIGLIFLGSLLAPRPMMFGIARQFVAGSNRTKLDWWNGRWRNPAFRSSMRWTTAVWGIAYLLEAAARVYLALRLPPAKVVALSPVMTIGVTVLLIVWTRRRMLGVRAAR